MCINNLSPYVRHMALSVSVFSHCHTLNNSCKNISLQFFFFLNKCGNTSGGFLSKQ